MKAAEAAADPEAVYPARNRAANLRKASRDVTDGHWWSAHLRSGRRGSWRSPLTRLLRFATAGHAGPSPARGGGRNINFSFCFVSPMAAVGLLVPVALLTIHVEAQLVSGGKHRERRPHPCPSPSGRGKTTAAKAGTGPSILCWRTTRLLLPPLRPFPPRVWPGPIGAWRVLRGSRGRG